jgi:hypothetical protein
VHQVCTNRTFTRLVAVASATASADRALARLSPTYSRSITPSCRHRSTSHPTKYTSSFRMAGWRHWTSLRTTPRTTLFWSPTLREHRVLRPETRTGPRSRSRVWRRRAKKMRVGFYYSLTEILFVHLDVYYCSGLIPLWFIRFSCCSRPFVS